MGGVYVTCFGNENLQLFVSEFLSDKLSAPDDWNDRTKEKRLIR